MPTVNGIDYPDTQKGHDEARQALKDDRQQFYNSTEGKPRTSGKSPKANLINQYLKDKKPLKYAKMRKGGSVSKSQNSGLYGRK